MNPTSLVLLTHQHQPSSTMPRIFCRYCERDAGAGVRAATGVGSAKMDGSPLIRTAAMEICALGVQRKSGPAMGLVLAF